MLPNNVIDAKVEGNLGGETVKMEIDVEATAHLMSVLTDLYSDRIMAFIREYATNAWDAHVEAGVTRPIEVSLPSRMSSYYHIKDYGTGLDLEGIKNIYSKYGASTKRGSNDFNGMLGLGCKSAMTYAAQFSIVSVKDGVKYNVAVSRGADGVGEMQVIDQTFTSEPNGVEIVIPVKTTDIWSVAEKAKSFFQWWPEGTVLVNGAKPARFEGREIAKNLYMIDGLEKDLIVMGNVPYPIPFEGGIYAGESDRFGYSRKSFGVVYFAEMGAVTFAPSREALQTTKNTKDTVEKAKALFIENLKKSLQKEFDAIDTRIEVLKHRRALESRYRDIDFGGFTYKGEAIPTKGWEAPFREVTIKASSYDTLRGIKDRKVKEYDYFFWYDADGGSPESKREELSLETVERYGKSMVVLVNAPKSLTTHQKTKMRRARADGVLEFSWLLLTSEATKPGGVWTDEIKVVDWSVVRDFKLASAGTSDSTKHDVYEATGAVTKRAVPDAEKIVYVSPTFFRESNYYNPKAGAYIKYANEHGYSFVQLSANRHDKFAREHKNALNLGDFVKMRIAEYEKSLTAADRELLGMDVYDIRRLHALSGVDIHDKDMVALSKRAEIDRFNALKKAREYHDIKARHNGVAFAEIKDVEPFANYPLISCLGYDEVKRHAQHCADYINAVVGQQKKGN